MLLARNIVLFVCNFWTSI